MKPQDAYGWEQRYRARAEGAMRAAKIAVDSATVFTDDSEAVAVAKIEAIARLAAALVLADAGDASD